MVRIVSRPDRAPKDEEEEVLAGGDDGEDGGSQGEAGSDDGESSSSDEEATAEAAGPAVAVVDGAVNMDIDEGEAPSTSDPVRFLLY